MISALVYDDGGVTNYDETELNAARNAEGTTWVRATIADDFERVAETFGIHPLTVEDVRNDSRPKTEEYDEYTFVIVRVAILRKGEQIFEEEVQTNPVGLCFGDDWLVTLTRQELTPIDRVWEAIEQEKRRMLRFGPDFVAYRVVDRTVDEYFDLLDEVGEEIELIEDSLLEGANPEVLEGLNAVRRDLLSFRKTVWPTREAAGVLARGDPEYVREETEKYYRDVYDHLVEVVDLTETYRELARGARDIYLNTLSQSTNEVMKTLTVVATIILPLTLVVGIYGMNFDPTASAFNMPELGWEYGYVATMLGMALVSTILLVYFQIENWL
ncbi:magnesium/cobalt transporter CorA [Haloferax mediterranei ATCC 33500]|uniref:Magnesium transport protein CorA n=1 Tax=Haloferax mediterranei (strain ATCC 33500 / DSM 1411 / JCM 8866 / NBRC 14739 / NCIMB 2177 / R-4) TaxID=523841 RepID=I3R5G2_HALMT|nr:magnesium/cobalt transporter CorA [Haloferax mediterranei]AFK19472.1 magnesium Mg(2+)/cobalt Co(2+) transport protein [Haloferax mediterranei ATCC 33500]AHZ21183.1 magnesium transporter [Haloferax mediterranei ATCC 33500]EMA04340.1 magnesium Mg(2+)/cobalt Co(2+) transport protein [Haloferax mediterranei ATCC 33500]MDX5989575.1 magnesium/cobalt transporter CorA [Haloferax mediterranei ATCC 33500]QCQ75933.1 magnesium/cobalt transporter CorA [Haloferax mediterranei ATCC 33500]